MPSALSERDWELLLKRIDKGHCTPFLGAGACYGSLPLGKDIAQAWAEEYSYPLGDTGNLPRVAQFLATTYDNVFPKEELLDKWRQEPKTPNFEQEDEPHGVLARLPLPLYITTNYDDFMIQALRQARKDPKYEACRWNQHMRNKYGGRYELDTTEPTAANPVVFHLHGSVQETAESLVLTEDDYLDFLVNITRYKDLLPIRIQAALTSSSLLFIGYSLQDLNFRVIFRALLYEREISSRYQNVSIQLPDTPDVQNYFDKYYRDNLKIQVYWGTAQQFVKELSERWKAHENDSQ